MFRNAIFSDLVTYHWPVTNSDGNSVLHLCYYIGYWLPSAFISKLCNNISVGYFFQFLWGFGGVTLAFFLISTWLKKIDYRTILLLILFSGLDILVNLKLSLEDGGIQYLVSTIVNSEHLDNQIRIFNSSSTTTLLFWLYNQIIPFWVGFMLILLIQKSNKILFFTYSLLIIFAPFPTLALVPAIIFLEIRNSDKYSSIVKTIASFIKKALSIENIAGLCLMIVVALYYISNISANKLGSLPFSKNNIIKFGIYFLFEYGIYILFVYKKLRKNYLFHIMMATMIVCSFITMGTSSDFAWRTAIPFTFYLMLMVIKELIEMPKNTLKFKLLTFTLLIGSATPAVEITRTLRKTFRSKEPFRNDRLKSTFDDNECYGNFIGSENSVFYKYLMRKL